MGLLGRFRRRRPPVLPDLADDGTLPVVVASSDAARADSAVLAEAEAAGTDVAQPLLVRHHLVLPHEDAVAQAAALLADEGYRLVAEPGPDGLLVRASRTQLVTGLGVAQERSRMAGLAQRLGGDVRGWDACAPPSAP